MASWIRERSYKINFSYFIFDAIHLITIIVFAISIRLCESWLEYPLGFIFGVAGIGHFIGAWVKPDNKSKLRFWLVGSNSLGFILLVALSNLNTGEFYSWNIPISLGFVLLFWLSIRYVYKLKNKKYMTEETNKNT